MTEKRLCRELFLFLILSDFAVVFAEKLWYKIMVQNDKKQGVMGYKDIKK